MNRLALLLVLPCLFGSGCDSAPTSDPDRKITWEEYQKMDAEQKADPYTRDNLDDEAEAKLRNPRKKSR